MQATLPVTRTEPRLVLGRYRLLDQIAVGGTARVHRARDEQLGREVAVKLLHPHLLPDGRSRRRLEAEARAAAGLAHPGIATVYDVDPDPEAPAIVMELVDGEPLSAHLARGPMQPREVARLGAEVADALFHAHRRGIVHRDVKPGNILLERETRRARLVDFGIAHSLAFGAESLTQTGTALGTPRYMAPEQMAGRRVGPRTDLWALGAVLYEALTGRVPFDGPTPLAIAEQQRRGTPPMPGTEPALAAIVTGCLAFEMEERPLDAAELASALRAWTRGGTTEIIAPPLTAAAVAAIRPEAPDRALAAAPRPAPGRRALLSVPVLAGVAALLLLAVLVLPGVLSGLLSGLDRDPSGVSASTPRPTSQPTPDAVEQLQAAYLEACGEPLSPDEIQADELAESIEEVNEEIAECLEDDRHEGEGPGGGPPPKDDGRGNGNEGNQGNGNGNGNGRGGGGD